MRHFLKPMTLSILFTGIITSMQGLADYTGYCSVQRNGTVPNISIFSYEISDRLTATNGSTKRTIKYIGGTEYKPGMNLPNGNRIRYVSWSETQSPNGTRPTLCLNASVDIQNPDGSTDVIPCTGFLPTAFTCPTPTATPRPTQTPPPVTGCLAGPVLAQDAPLHTPGSYENTTLPATSTRYVNPGCYWKNFPYPQYGIVTYELICENKKRAQLRRFHSPNIAGETAACIVQAFDINGNKTGDEMTQGSVGGQCRFVLWND